MTKDFGGRRVPEPGDALPVPERTDPVAPVAVQPFAQPATNDSGLAGQTSGLSTIGSVAATVEGPVGVQKLAESSVRLARVSVLVTEAYTRQMIEGKPLDRVVLDAKALFAALGADAPASTDGKVPEPDGSV